MACTLNDRELAELGATADVCLALGSRLTELSCTGWIRPFPSRVIRAAYSDEIPAFAESQTTVVHVDARVAADRRDRRAPQRSRAVVGIRRRGRREGGRPLRVARPVESRAPVRRRDRVRALRAGDTFVCDMTKLAFWTIGGLVVPDGVRYLFPGLLAMGFGLPAALGASLAATDGHVIALVGDGGLVSILSELDLAAGWPGRVTVVLSDDDGYHILRPNMNDEVGPRVCEFEGPRWEMLASACGAGYAEAPDPGALAHLLGQPHDGVRILRIDASEVGLGWRRATRPVHA